MSRPKLFVSYSHIDAEAIGRDIAMLERDYQISHDRDIQPGTDWRGHIANELMSCAGVLYYSSLSANRSEHCLAEVSFALDLDKPILVIQLDGHELPPGLRMYLARSQALRPFELAGSEYQAALVNAVDALAERQPDTQETASREVRLKISMPASKVQALIEAFLQHLSSNNTRHRLELVEADADADVHIGGSPEQVVMSRGGSEQVELVRCDELPPVELLNRFYQALCRMVQLALDIDVFDANVSVSLRSDTQDIEALTKFIQALHADKTWDLHGALDRFESALRHDPEFALCCLHAAVVALNLGERASGKSYYARAFAGLERLSDQDQYSLRSTYLISNGDYQRAVDELERYLAAYPGRTTTMQNLALSYLYSRDPEAALRTAAQSLEFGDNYFDQANHAMYQMYAGRYDECEKTLLEIGMQGSVYDLATTMAVCQVMQGNVDEAQRIYESLQLGTESQQLAGHLGLADLHAYRGDYERALAVCGNAALSNDPMSLRIAAYGAVFGSLAGRPERLPQNLHDYLFGTEQAELASQDAYLLGRAAAHLGELDLADRRLVALQERLDSTSKLYAELLQAELLIGNGADTVAVVSLLKESLGRIDSWMGRFLLASAYRQSGQSMDAIIEWQKCLQRSGEAVAVMLDETPTLHLYGRATALYEQTRNSL